MPTQCFIEKSSTQKVNVGNIPNEKWPKMEKERDKRCGKVKLRKNELILVCEGKWAEADDEMRNTFWLSDWDIYQCSSLKVFAAESKLHPFTDPLIRVVEGLSEGRKLNDACRECSEYLSEWIGRTAIESVDRPSVDQQLPTSSVSSGGQSDCRTHLALKIWLWDIVIAMCHGFIILQEQLCWNCCVVKRLNDIDARCCRL